MAILGRQKEGVVLSLEWVCNILADRQALAERIVLGRQTCLLPLLSYP